jgi:hypothetical protein
VPVANYTTTVPVTRTVAEVSKMLAEHGAQRVAVDYTDRVPSGITFAIPEVGLFTLPVDIDAMRQVLTEQAAAGIIRGNVVKVASRAQAERVAWRVLRDWLRAQLAIIETRMVSLPEVMLPYLHTDDGRTLREAYVTRALPPGPERL